MFLVVFVSLSVSRIPKNVGHNPEKNPLHFGRGWPDGGAIISTFMFWPNTFEP